MSSKLLFLRNTRMHHHHHVSLPDSIPKLSVPATPIEHNPFRIDINIERTAQFAIFCGQKKNTHITYWFVCAYFTAAWLRWLSGTPSSVSALPSSFSGGLFQACSSPVPISTYAEEPVMYTTARIQNTICHWP